MLSSPIFPFCATSRKIELRIQHPNSVVLAGSEGPLSSLHPAGDDLASHKRHRLQQDLMRVKRRQPCPIPIDENKIVI